MPRRHDDIVTAALAESQTFHNQDPNSVLENYEHAGWLAKTTIQKHGLAKWREFLRICQINFLNNSFETAGSARADVTEQYQQVFGEPMP